MTGDSVIGDGTIDEPDRLLDVARLSKSFVSRRNLLGRPTEVIRAVDDVSFHIGRGEILGLVGESGCGKSTVARLLLGLIEPDAGSVRFDGAELTALSRAELVAKRRKIQMVFQDPYGCLDPTKTILDAVGEPLKVHLGMRREPRREAVERLLRSVGLDASHLERYPHEFSGGQRQRIAIARALALEPELVVCDEPVSALDVSTQAQVLNLLLETRNQRGLSLLFISHDMSVVRHVSDRLVVMYLGTVVETGPATAVYEAPQHPYTRALLSSVLVPSVRRQRERHRVRLTGELPSPADVPRGCPFAGRCPQVMDVCHEVRPRLEPVATRHAVACHLGRAPVAVGGSSGQSSGGAQEGR
jgi:oligopeptide transport system ATP-binding protein